MRSKNAHASLTKMILRLDLCLLSLVNPMGGFPPVIKVISGCISI
jgi:hypothetical protein